MQCQQPGFRSRDIWPGDQASVWRNSSPFRYYIFPRTFALHSALAVVPYLHIFNCVLALSISQNKSWRLLLKSLRRRIGSVREKITRRRRRWNRSRKGRNKFQEGVCTIVVCEGSLLVKQLSQNTNPLLLPHSNSFDKSCGSPKYR